jgi:hypothetical protein
LQTRLTTLPLDYSPDPEPRPNAATLCHRYGADVHRWVIDALDVTSAIWQDSAAWLPAHADRRPAVADQIVAGLEARRGGQTGDITLRRCAELPVLSKLLAVTNRDDTVSTDSLVGMSGTRAARLSCRNHQFNGSCFNDAQRAEPLPLAQAQPIRVQNGGGRQCRR